MIYYGCFPRGRHDNNDNKDKDKTMIKMMMVEDKEEAKKVDEIFSAIYWTIANGWKATDATSYCEETDTFRYKDIEIPRGSIVYVFRDIGGGEAVWDIYKFGYCGEYLVSKDNEGDVAGLVNAGSSWFPF